jgi:hypothetical protein
VRAGSFSEAKKILTTVPPLFGSKESMFRMMPIARSASVQFVNKFTSSLELTSTPKASVEKRHSFRAAQSEQTRLPTELIPVFDAFLEACPPDDADEGKQNCGRRNEEGNPASIK